MKKTIMICFILLLFMASSIQGFALQVPGYEGGIKNEMTYREVIFVTGEPIVVEGTLSITDRGDRVSYIYRDLSNAEMDVTMTRNVTIDKTVTENGNDQRQETYSVSRYRESIRIGNVRYELTEQNHPWSKSNIYHQKPGVTYFAGNWDGKKVYTINRNQGTVTVQTSGNVVGYDHNWGTTETQTISHYIDYDRQINGEDPIRWQGTVSVDVANNRTKSYHYEPNTPSQISFRGGYLLTERDESILKYSYDLPRVDEEGFPLRGRNVGTNSTSLNTNPNNQRLTIPAMRDISGHWAERHVLLLASLEAVYPNSTDFGPNLPMSRGDFARAVAILMDIQQEQPATNQRTRTAQPVVVAQTFNDVSQAHPNQNYIEAVYQKGIMAGVGDNSFKPNESLTRAQAAVVLIKALGFENLAPIQQYSTGFRDDQHIPLWARNSVYLARELGLVSGSTDGYFYPNNTLTKAEAAAMLTNFIDYLREDIRYDYRERILNY